MFWNNNVQNQLVISVYQPMLKPFNQSNGTDENKILMFIKFVLEMF